MVGIFGGTFDPVHYGHLRAALEVKEIFGLDQVRLILSAQPPHRPAPQASAACRLAMLTLAVQNQSGFIIDTREIDRAGASYTVLTLESLRLEFPNQALLLFIGTDAFEHLKAWYQWQRLFDLAHVVVLTRPGYQIGQLDASFRERLTTRQSLLSERHAGILFFQTITQLDISASAIRLMLGQGRSPRFLLPDAVLNYITAHKLYENV